MKGKIATPIFMAPNLQHFTDLSKTSLGPRQNRTSFWGLVLVPTARGYDISFRVNSKRTSLDFFRWINANQRSLEIRVWKNM